GTSGPLLPRGDETLALGGLDDLSRRSMVLSLLGAHSASEELFQTVLSKAEGNPLYMEEIVHQLRETNGLALEGGHATLRTVDVPVPATIHDIIAARVDRLRDNLKRALQGAAVVGREFAVVILARVLETNGELIGRLDTLSELDFVFPSGFDLDLAYSFKHALT